MRRRDHTPASAPDSDLAAEPARWSAARGGDDLGNRMGAGFRALAAAPVPTVPTTLPEGTRAVQASAVAVRARPGRAARSRLALGLATMALGAVVLAGALAAAKVYRRLRSGVATEQRALTAASAGRRSAHTAPALAVPLDLSGAPAPGTTKVPAPSGLAAPGTATEPPAASEDGEAALMARAFRSLRGEHDPAGALSLLDTHASRFPAGRLAAEASLARVEALLALGRRGEALAVLDRDAGGRGLVAGSAAGERGRERALLRGELRAEAGRCTEAIADFAAADHDAPAEIVARALWGRAACRARVGDEAAARRDLARYLIAFPAGPSAHKARRWLAEHARPATGDDPTRSTKSAGARRGPETFRP
jgi:hypothetical protein